MRFGLKQHMQLLTWFTRALKASLSDFLKKKTICWVCYSGHLLTQKRN